MAEVFSFASTYTVSMHVSAQVRYLEPEQVRISQPPGSSHLRVEILDERTILNAVVRRLFPLSNPESHVSIQDGAGKEVGILRNPNGLDATSLQLVSEALDRRYFTPLVSRIDTLKLDAGMWRFEVQTQRGPAEFYVRNWRDSSAEIEPGRWLVWSVDGQRFEIPQPDKLDARSVSLLEQLL